MIPSGLKKLIPCFLFPFFFLLPLVFAGPAPNKVLRIQISDEVINPVIAEYVHQAIRKAEMGPFECLIIELDTPGGLLSSTRHIVRDIVNAKIPVVVYIAPRGARAGSAGVFITLASHVAAMAPSTNIGAAHPVNLGGERRSVYDVLYEWVRAFREKPGRTPAGEKTGEDEKQKSVPEGKIVEDSVAWARTIAEARGRNAEWAERAVRESVSQTDPEALELKIIELIAADETELLTFLDGREIKLADGRLKTLRTRGAEIETVPLSARQKFLSVLIHPNIAYILMLLGFYGLLFEVTHPGFGFPGIAGFISLVLAFYAFQALPVNYAGFALMMLGILLIVGEVKMPGFGLFALGGVVCLFLGSVMLFETRDAFLRLSLKIAVPFVFGTAAVSFFLTQAVVRSHRKQVGTGPEALIGRRGIVETEKETSREIEGHPYHAQVFVRGEIWRAACPECLRRGETVEVIGIRGLVLLVRRIG